MLSRVAENIYWMARYVERAENTARLVRVNANLLLDLPRGVAPGWEPLVSIMGVDEEFNKRYTRATERNVVKFLIGDSSNPCSILNSLRAARENCRTVRDIIPRSGWEQINELYLDAGDNVHSGLTKSGRHAYLDHIISGSQTINGLLGSIVYRDEAYQFLRIGRNLERADMTTRIIDVRSTDLLPEETADSKTFDTIQWVSVLNSLSAYQAYRRKVQVQVRRDEALEFLFKNTLFPRAFMHCLYAVEESLGELKNNRDSLEVLRQLIHKVSSTRVDRLRKEQLHSFIDQLQLGLINLHRAMEETYFLPPAEAASAS
jgi:uncharacterized alpha-E superfamily protein